MIVRRSVHSLILPFFITVAAACSGPAAPSVPDDAVLYDSFEGSPCAVSPLWGEPLALDASHYSPNRSPSKPPQSAFVTTAHTGSCAGNYFAAEGTVEKTPWQIGMTDVPTNHLGELFGGEDPDEVAIQWWLFVQPGYPYASSSQKMVRLFYADKSQPASRKEVNFQPSEASGAMTMSAFCGATFGEEHNGKCQVDFGENSGEPTPEGEWVQYCGYVKHNTPGESDGTIRLTRNGETLLEKSGFSTRGNDTRGFNGIWIGGNYSGNLLKASGSIFYDDVAICRRCPCKTP